MDWVWCTRYVVSDFCDPMDFNPPGSSVHGILQVRILEWVAIFFSRGSSWPRDRSWVSCIAGRFFTVWATREAPEENVLCGRERTVWDMSVYTSPCHRQAGAEPAGLLSWGSPPPGVGMYRRAEGWAPWGPTLPLPGAQHKLTPLFCTYRGRGSCV